MASPATPLTHAEFRNQRHFASLDGIRAIAIILVFLAHPTHPWWSTFHGATGVTLFFSLSGFLITTLLLREEERYGSVSFRRFYVRRLFRIYPMFFATLILYMVLILGLGFEADRRDVFVEHIPYYVFFFPEHALYFVDDGNYPPFDGAWSIGIEEKFYLVWPVLAFAVLSRRRRWRLPVLVAAATASALLAFSATYDYLGAYQHIAYGAIAAVLLHHRSTFRFVALLGRAPVLLAALLATLALQLATDEIYPSGSLYWLDGLLMTAVTVGAVLASPRLNRWLTIRPMVILGEISYVFYLLHNFALNGWERLIPASGERVMMSVVSTALAFVTAVLASYIVHRTFEEPCRRWGARLAQRIEPRRLALASERGEVR